MKKICVHVLLQGLLLLGCTTFVPAQERTGYFLSKDTANQMLESYLNSIPVEEQGHYLRSLVLDANAIRSYLADTSIVKVKLMLAYTLPFAASPDASLPPDLKSGGITILLAGVNRLDDYVLYGTNSVVNFATPCPPTCFVSGTASADTLP
jgi:hypothetical protein